MYAAVTMQDKQGDGWSCSPAHSNVKVQCWQSLVAHQVFTMMLCKLPVLPAVAHPDAGQII